MVACTPVIFQYSYWKKRACKLTLKVQTLVVQGSTMYFILISWYQKAIMAAYPNMDDVSFDHLIKVLFARFLYHFYVCN